MTGQLCWIPTFASKGKLTLHLRLDPFHPWTTYAAFPYLCVPDYPVPGGSKGWATSQRLLQAGWEIVPTAKIKVSFREDFEDNSLAA